MSQVTFPAGTDFQNIECHKNGVLLADVMRDGQRHDVVVVGHCVNCRHLPEDRKETPSEESRK